MYSTSDDPIGPVVHKCFQAAASRLVAPKLFQSLCTEILLIRPLSSVRTKQTSHARLLLSASLFVSSSSSSGLSFLSVSAVRICFSIYVSSPLCFLKTTSFFSLTALALLLSRSSSFFVLLAAAVRFTVGTRSMTLCLT